VRAAVKVVDAKFAVIAKALGESFAQLRIENGGHRVGFYYEGCGGRLFENLCHRGH